MRLIYIFLLFISTTIYGGESIELDLSSDNIISIDIYPSEGEVLLLYCPQRGGSEMATFQQHSS